MRGATLLLASASGACFVAAASIVVAFDPAQLQPTHGSLLLLVFLGIARVLAETPWELLFAILCSLVPPFEACTFMLMPRDKSLWWLEHFCIGSSSWIVCLGPLCAAIMSAAIAASKLSQFTKLLTVVSYCCGYGFVFPCAVAYVHGVSIALWSAQSNFCFILIPGVSSFLLTTLWRKRKLARVATLAVPAEPVSAVQKPVPTHAAAQQMVPVAVVLVPVVVPGVYPLPESVPLPPALYYGHDLNDSDSESASASHSSAGDSAHLALWAPTAFGEDVEEDNGEQIHYA